MCGDGKYFDELYRFNPLGEKEKRKSSKHETRKTFREAAKKISSSLRGVKGLAIKAKIIFFL